MEYVDCFLLDDQRHSSIFQVPRILFAGEATHPGYYSTVNAALETGIAAAKKVLAEID